MDLEIERKISGFFKSRKLAIFLIFLIIIFSIIGTHIPQRSQIKPEIYNTWEKNHPDQAEIFDALGLTHLFSSFIFISLAALLFMNTFFCASGIIINSFRRSDKNKQFQKQKFISSLENNAIIRTKKDRKSIYSTLDAELCNRGYKVNYEDNRLFAEKNRMGVFGAPLFHICILFIIIAAVYGSTGRMEGDIQLVEGQSLYENHSNYRFINEGPFFYENHKNFGISLEKFYPEYTDETGTPRGPAGKLTIIENGLKKKTDIVYSNHQMDYEGYTFLGNIYGLAPLLLLVNPDGTIYSGSYITGTDLDNSGRYVSFFELGNTGLEAGLMVYMTTPLTAEITESGVIVSTPILFLKIFDNGKKINDVTLNLNETVKIGDKTLGFYDIKYWSNFYVVKDNSMHLILVGFTLMILTLLISFFYIPKRIWVEITDTEKGFLEIRIGGKSDKFRFLYGEEFSGIINNLEQRL